MSGKTVRLLRSDWTDAWDDLANPKALPMPLQAFLVNDFRGRIDHAAKRPADGATKLLTGPSGRSSVGSTRYGPPAKYSWKWGEYADTVAAVGRLADGD